MIIEESIPHSTRLIKYLIKKNNSIYFVYVSVGMDNYTEFWLKKDEYGIMEFEIGFIIDTKNIKEYIDIQIDNWIENYEETLEKLEN